MSTAKVPSSAKVPGGAPEEEARPPRPAPSEPTLRRDMPLVPISSIAGRALVTVVAIMTFLGALAAGSAVLINSASGEWRHAVAREMTIQVRPVAGQDLDAEAAKAAAAARAVPGVAAVEVYDRAAGERLLEPWLGSGLDLSDLPIPRLIVVRLADDAAFDVKALQEALRQEAPNATLDDHHLWLHRLAAMARTMVAIAAAIFLLVLVAMGLAVGFATRGAMAGNQEIVGVLHFVGAEDRFIAREFQRHFLRLGLRGGLIGGACAMATFAGAGLLERWMAATPGGDQIEALFGTFTLGVSGYLAIALIVAGVAVLTGAVSRSIVFRHLRAYE